MAYDSPEKKRAYQREYQQRPEVRERRREFDRNSPEKKQYQARSWKRRTNALRGMKMMLDCLDCGVSGMDIVLDFDHRDNEERLFAPANVTGLPWPRLWAEWEKCDPRCRSCHMRRHREAAA